MSEKINLPQYCSIESNKSGIDASWINLSTDKLDFYLVFELKGPWDRKVEFSTSFPPGLNETFQEAKTSGKRFKFICIKPDNNYTTDNFTKIIYYIGPKGYFSKLAHIELEVPNEKITEVIKSLIYQNKTGYQIYLSSTSYIRDIFVCGHMIRDACCGKFGIEILEYLKNKYSHNSNVRIWESSHIGGHRVGPTILDMPNGRFWGYLNPHKTYEIIEEKTNHLEVIDNYRGTIGLDRFSQIVENEIFKRKGWDWLKLSKKSEIIERDNRDTKILINYLDNNNNELSITANIIQSGEIKLLESGCGKGASLPTFKISNLVIHT